MKTSKSYIEWKRIDKRWNEYINRSMKAYDRNDNKTENKYADMLEKEIAEYGVTCYWPGLAPCFQYNGHEFYDVESIINELSKD